MKKTEAELETMFEYLDMIGPPIGSKWRHHRGGRYVVVGLGLNSTTCEPEIVYTNEENHFRWVRTLKEWSEVVTNEHGEEVPRFSPRDD